MRLWAGIRGIPLNRETAWYGGDEARRIADIVVSFQTPAGGWSKNLNMTRHVRAPARRSPRITTRVSSVKSDFDTPHDANWNYVGTFDNDATTTQLRFLAKVIAALLPLRARNIAPRFCTVSTTSSPRNIRTAAGRRCGRSKVVTTTPSPTTMAR